MNMPRIFKPFNIPATKNISDSQTSLTDALVTSATLLIYSESGISAVWTQTYINNSHYRLKLTQIDESRVYQVYYLNPGQKCSFTAQNYGGSDSDDWRMYVEITAFTEGGHLATINNCPPFLLMQQQLNKKEDSMTVIKPTVHNSTNTINISATATTIECIRLESDRYRDRYSASIDTGKGVQYA